MRSALEELTLDKNRVHLRFTPVDEVQLTVRGEDHTAACVRGQNGVDGANAALKA